MTAKLSLDANLPSLDRPLGVFSFEDVTTEKEIVGRLAYSNYGSVKKFKTNGTTPSNSRCIAMRA